VAAFVLADGVVDANNTSTTPLGANATFTGPATDLMPFLSLRINIFSDQNSATSGSSIQFSSDGVNWDHQFPFILLTVNQPLHMPISRVARFFRIVYKNGAIAQGAFRLNTILQRATEQSSHALIGSTRLQDADSALLTRSVIAGKAVTQGDYVNCKVGVSGALQIVSEGSVLGDVITAVKRSQYDVKFSGTDATDTSIITNTQTGTGAVTQVGGLGIFSTGVGAAGTAKGVTVQVLNYRPGTDIYAEF